jgi:hypothetical protein
VAEWPECLVGEAEVVALDVFLGEPYAPKGVGRVFRRDPNPVVRVDDLAIGVPMTPRHPGPSHRLEDGVEGQGEAPCRSQEGDPAVLVHMGVGLPVGDDDEIAAPEVVHESVADALRSPVRHVRKNIDSRP